ncbi:Lrp/AsnC family transcriptional regulator [Rhizobiales bacterium]|uniref:Lrp/AsnC family transcriptional regulator n=1 Tax=Hongsoonwoonella zoysiae TaxID=2821844 RepID=UPI0015600316|nr:Lrp/AsnC family transcriptional regulator [Hongsoonwoonella zoysiae]NRG19287.1 Lrp/AsnC family transcriptional regulator [Hongsoonwoonella zoysiae]
MRDFKDNLDRRLVALLQTNARMATSEIARKLKVARSTVQERITRLENCGLISGYTVLLSSAPEVEAVHALVMIAVEQQQVRETIKRLEMLPEIRTCFTVSGEFDLFLRVEAPRLEDLDEVLDEIAAIPGVRRSRSSIVLASKFDRGSVAGNSIPII